MASTEDEGLKVDLKTTGRQTLKTLITDMWKYSYLCLKTEVAPYLCINKMCLLC